MRLANAKLLTDRFRGEEVLLIVILSFKPPPLRTIAAAAAPADGGEPESVHSARYVKLHERVDWRCIRAQAGAAGSG